MGSVFPVRAGIAVLSFIALFAFGCSENSAPVDESAAEADVSQGDNASELQEWKDWAESSDQPAGFSGGEVHLELLQTVSGQGTDNYFNPAAIATDGEILVVTDQGQERLFCFNLSDTLDVWAMGEPGEGPGHFSRIGHAAIIDSTVYIGNMMNSRIDRISTSGEYLSDISISSPFDLAVMNDTLLVATSLAENDFITVFNTDTGDKLWSFGGWDTSLETNIVISNRNMFSCVLGDSILAVASFYESNVRLYNIYTMEMVNEFYRRIPLSIPENDPGFFNIHIVDICAFDDTTLVVVLPPLTSEKTQVTSLDDDIAELAVCDRYSIYGEYLDSFIIPENVLEITVIDSCLWVANPLESAFSEYIIR